MEYQRLMRIDSIRGKAKLWQGRAFSFSGSSEVCRVTATGVEVSEMLVADEMAVE